MNTEETLNKILDGMADFETRISWCENALTYTSRKNTEEPKVTIPKEHKLYNELQQLKARFIYIQNQINSITDKKTHSSYIYSSIREVSSDEKLHLD